MNFFRGILTDLRERGLLPVAIALAVALVALPMLLHKSSSSPSATASPAATAPPGTGTGAPLVTLAALRTSSDLDTFDTKNPFQSLRPVADLATPDLLTPTTPTDDSSSGTDDGGTGDSLTFDGGTGGSVPTDPVTPVDPVTPPTDDDDPPTDPGDDTDTVTKALFTHEVEIAFGRQGKTRTITGIRRLTMLPNPQEPLLVFLGVDPTATAAMFLVDGDLEQSGEGVCRPSPGNCRFLSLRIDDAQDEHLLLDEAGNEFYVRLRNIDRVVIDEDGKSSSISSFPRLLDVEEISIVETPEEPAP